MGETAYNSSTETVEFIAKCQIGAACKKEVKKRSKLDEQPKDMGGKCKKEVKKRPKLGGQPKDMGGKCEKEVKKRPKLDGQPKDMGGKCEKEVKKRPKLGGQPKDMGGKCKKARQKSPHPRSSFHSAMRLSSGSAFGLPIAKSPCTVSSKLPASLKAYC